MSRLRLTERALSDIEEIARDSVERWGPLVADEYLSDLGAALDRLEADLSLFRERREYTGRLRFYAVREHVLVGDVIAGVGYILTVWWSGMDFIERLSKLEPVLMDEAELLARKIESERPPGG